MSKDKHSLVRNANPSFQQLTDVQLRDLIIQWVNNANTQLLRAELREIFLQLLGLVGSGGGGGSTVTGASISGNTITINRSTGGNITGTVLLTGQTQVTALQNKVVTNVAFSGTGTKTLTLTFADASTLTANFTDESGGGGGAAAQWTNLGSGVWAEVSGTVSHVRSAGKSTITIASGGYLGRFNIVGAAGDLSSGEYTVEINDANAAGSYNTNDATSRYPTIFVQNRTVVLPTDPFLQRPDDAADSITIFDLRWTTNNIVSSKVTGLSGDWGLKCSY